MKKVLLKFSLFIILFSIVFAASFSSVKADEAEYNNYSDNISSLLSCGSGFVKDIPSSIPKLTSMIYTIIQIGVPVVLVIFGSIDLIKGVTAQKEDEIKKGQQMFIKRLIPAVLVFFVFIIVKFVVSFAANSSRSAKILDCVECFINNNCSTNMQRITKSG